MKPTKPPNDIQAAAAEWLARRDAGLNPGEAAALQAWLGADPQQAATFHELEATWSAFDAPRRRGDADRMIVELTRRQRRRTRRMAFGATASLVVAAAAAWMVYVGPTFHPGAAIAPGFATGNVVWLKPERQVLDDGSVVELSHGTHLAVHFSAGRRDVELSAGDAHFSVAKDPSRPFVVSTPKSSFRAVGTVFAVAVRPQGAELVVTEGKVAAARSAGATPTAPEPAVIATAGEHVIADASAAATAPLRAEPITAAEIERRLAWRAPRLELSGTPLSDVAAAFNRENRIRLTLANPSLAHLRLTGVFRVDRVEAFVQLLENYYGIEATRRGSDEIVLDRPPGKQ